MPHFTFDKLTVSGGVGGEMTLEVATGKWCCHIWMTDHRRNAKFELKFFSASQAKVGMFKEVNRRARNVEVLADQDKWWRLLRKARLLEL